MVHDAGPSDGRLERLRLALPGRRRRRLRPLAPAAATRSAERPADLQPRLADRAPPRAAAHDGARGGQRRARPLRARRARLSARAPGGVPSQLAMDLSLFFAGTAGSVPTARRGLPALLLRARRRPAALRLRRGHPAAAAALASGCPTCDAIFLTHYHVDHWLGLLGMLKTFDLRAREAPLDVHGPPGLQALLALAARRRRPPRLPADARRARPPRRGRASADYTIVRLRRSTTASRPTATRSSRTTAPGRFDAETAERLGVTPGPDFGRLQAGETVGGVRPEQVVGPPRPGAADRDLGRHRARARRSRSTPHGADVLVHEATFMSDERDRARGDRPQHRPPGRRDRPRRRRRGCSR